ncbi:hypothetical protein KDH_72790 [Dictyobacter sp. S3.2.2.5]|uniref:DUF4037 domain-containing protein n=1 Tax=Dictyobacter halimunensis TaxID=3026934 RepID=A0ABQ6G366_9CHLR|nr:hypothetical protein KDH_72790 [Dictyobacter sp. S3.2.2.5]
MKGLELAESFFFHAVLPIIERKFPPLDDRYAAGLLGYGSDVLGHDDEWSRDHEWGPRCILWLDERDYARYAERLNMTLNEQLPASFRGYATRFRFDEEAGCLVPAPSEEEGFHHVAITTVTRYLKLQYGLTHLELTPFDWLCIPEQKLLELTRGRIFVDPVGDITAVREEFAYLPDDVWRYKLSYAWEKIKDYDVVGLCAARGDTLSARIMLYKVVEHVVRLTFLLNRAYCPGTMKWFSREFYALPRLAGEVGPRLESCLVLDDLGQSVLLLEEALSLLYEEQRRLEITRPCQLLPPSAYSRGQMSVSFADVQAALRDSLPVELQDCDTPGAIDQWVTNDDLLLFADNFRKFKYVYQDNEKIPRNDVGDLLL